MMKRPIDGPFLQLVYTPSISSNFGYFAPPSHGTV